MINSKTIRILRTLNTGDLKGLGDYIYSPFFNKNKKCIALFELLLPYAPAFSSDELAHPEFTASIYQNKGSMQTLMKTFLRLVEGYLVDRILVEKKGLKKHILLEELRRMGERKYFNVVYKKAMDNIAGEKEGKEKYYETYLLELSMLRMNYETRENHSTIIRQIDTVLLAFDKFTLSSHLWLDNTALNLIQKKETPGDLEKTTANIISNSEVYAQKSTQPPFDQEPLIQMHSCLRKLYHNDKEENFMALFQILKKYYSDISKSDYDYFYKYLVNSGIQQMIKGHENYFNIVLDIYLFAMKIGAFVEGEYLESSRMRNIIILSCKSDNLDLATSILDKYIPTVNPLYKEATEYYCRGHIKYKKKEYESAIYHFNKCMDLKSIFMLYAQVEIYQIYYDINEHWAFDVPIQSFIIKLSRQKHKYSKNIISGHLNFFKILKQIYKKKENPNYKKDIDEILFTLNSLEHISNKKWLVEKISEL